MKKTASDIIIDIIVYTLLALTAIVTAYPMIYILLCSVSDVNTVMSSNSILIIPKKLDWAAYEAVFKSPNILVGYKNTIIYTVVGTVMSVFLTLLAGYVLSRKWLYGRGFFTAVATIPMFITGGMIPTYLLIKNLHLLNSRWAVLLSGTIAVYNIIITRTFMAGIPDALEEAAHVDGANDLYIFARIFLPLSKPVIAVNALYYAVGRWNEWFSAMIYIKDRSLYPLQMFLREILIQTQMSDMGAMKQQMAQNAKYATIIVSIVPILLVYPFVQKYFVKGVMVGAIKG